MFINKVYECISINLPIMNNLHKKPRKSNISNFSKSQNARVDKIQLYSTTFVSFLL